MTRRHAAGLISFVFLVIPRPVQAFADVMTLDGAWRLQSSAKATEGGAALSRPGFAAEGWYAITVPNTVVGALVENGTYRDPYTAMNLRALPGMTYPVARNFGHLPMSPESPFARGWWYHREFDLPAALSGRALWLHFDANTYWLSTHDDVLDWAKTKWFYTPVTTHADLTALARLPATSLDLSTRFEPAGSDGTAVLRVTNRGAALAFQVHLTLAQDGAEVLPVWWDDNYFELLPGESREVRVAYPRRGGAGAPVTEADAWNAPAVRR